MAAAPEYFSQTQRTALIVDDSRLACAVLGRLLEQEGFHVEMAFSAQEALERLRKEHPDVVFMDHLMPGMTGLDAVRALKADSATAGIPVVMFSSQEGPEFASAAREAGAIAVLTKHTERSNLGYVLERLGDARPARAEAPAQPAMARPPAAPQLLPTDRLTREDLRREMAPMLREQRDQIRTELLAEFAILENHQDNMRRALLGRLETLLSRGLAQVGDQLAERLAPAAPRWTGVFARCGLAAAALALLAVPTGLLIDQQRQLDALSVATRQAQAAADTQAKSLDAVRRQVEGLGASVGDVSRNLREAVEIVSWRSTIPVVAGTAADAKTVPLTEVLASTGISGPVELRGRSGSYCLELAGTGYRLTPMPHGTGSCFTGERMPILAGMTPAAVLPPGR
jgi:CheY-like chemotaxis protein